MTTLDIKWFFYEILCLKNVLSLMSYLNEIILSLIYSSVLLSFVSIVLLLPCPYSQYVHGTSAQCGKESYAARGRKIASFPILPTEHR